MFFFSFFIWTTAHSLSHLLILLTFARRRTKIKSGDKSRTNAFRSLFIVVLCVLCHSKHCWCWNSNRIICIGIMLRMRYFAHWRNNIHGANAWTLSWFLLCSLCLMSSHFSKSTTKMANFIRTKMYIYKDQFAHFVYLVLVVVSQHTTNERTRMILLLTAHEMASDRPTNEASMFPFIAFVHG